MVLALGVCAALLVLALTACLNALVFPRLRPSGPAAAAPLVSVLIPARDEAAVIAETVRALLAQTGVTLEVLVLDDHSTDGTAGLALAAAAGDPRLRVLTGRPLPPGWLGKNWACHQLAEAARGEWLVFTDADVRWAPGALAALCVLQGRLRADLLTVWPTQLTHTWGERLVVPLLALAIGAYLPVLAVHHLPGRAFAAAMGQCLLFQRAAYHALGGHAAVRDQIVEDVALARRLKGRGGRLRMADGNGLIACRMYRAWGEVRRGFAKNILAGHGGQVWALAASTLFHWAVFVLPWLATGAAISAGRWEAAAPWGAALVMGVGVRALTAAATHQRIGDAVLMPVSVLLMTMIAAQSVWWQATGGPRWKGRRAAAGKGVGG